MTNSVIRVFDVPPQDNLVIYVAEDGTVTLTKKYVLHFFRSGGRNCSYARNKK